MQCNKILHIFLDDKPSFTKQIESGCDKLILLICGRLAVTAGSTKLDTTDGLVQPSGLRAAPLNTERVQGERWKVGGNNTNAWLHYIL